MNIVVLANEVATELTKLGHVAVLGRTESDCAVIELDGFAIRGVEIGFGANKGRVEWQGFAPTDANLHYMERPVLASTTSSLPNPMRIAKQIVSKIIEPAKEPLATYAAKRKAASDRIAALPAQMELVRSYGFTVHETGPSGTEANFYVSGEAVNGSARVNHAGALYFDRLSIAPEHARDVLQFIRSLGA